MDKTSSRIALVPTPAADPRAQPPAAEEAQARRRRVALALACLLRIAVIALLAHDIAPSAWRARHDPVELAVVAGPCTLLAAVFVCIHRAERLTPGPGSGSPPGERRRLHIAVWVLSVPMFCLVAYQLSRAMPVATVIAVWSFTSFLLLAGFYMLVLHQYQQYQDLDGDGKAFERTSTPTPTDELV